MGPPLSHLISLSGTYRQELEARGVEIHHGIDATRLDTFPELTANGGGFDLIVFNYPCIGHHSLLDDGDKIMHARRHHTLLSHFFHSAQSILSPTGLRECHVTLCARMPETWGLVEAAMRMGMVVKHEKQPTARNSFLPDGHWVWKASGDSTDGLVDEEDDVEIETTGARLKARRKYRGGALGCAHWAARDGYEFRHHANDNDMRVGNSRAFVFARPTLLGGDGKEAGPALSDARIDPARWCAVCAMQFLDADGFKAHTQSATPDVRFDSDLHACHCCTPPRTFQYLHGLQLHVASMEARGERGRGDSSSAPNAISPPSSHPPGGADPSERRPAGVSC
jgi:hypothetical protein